MTRLTPAQATAQTGLSIDTLRYYEKEGLIGPVERDTAGRRTYGDDDVFWIGLVTCLRDAGLGIADLREFTGLVRSREAAAQDKVGFLQAHRERLLERREAIDRALAVVGEKIEHYSAG